MLKEEHENYKLYIQTSFGDKIPEPPMEDVFELYMNPLSCPAVSVKTFLDIAGAKYNTHIVDI